MDNAFEASKKLTSNYYAIKKLITDKQYLNSILYNKDTFKIHVNEMRMQDWLIADING